MVFKLSLPQMLYESLQHCSTEIRLPFPAAQGLDNALLMVANTPLLGDVKWRSRFGAIEFYSAIDPLKSELDVTYQVGSNLQLGARPVYLANWSQLAEIIELDLPLEYRSILSALKFKDNARWRELMRWHVQQLNGRPFSHFSYCRDSGSELDLAA